MDGRQYDFRGLTGLHLSKTLGVENKGEEAGEKRHGDHPCTGRGAKRDRLVNQFPVTQKGATNGAGEVGIEVDGP